MLKAYVLFGVLFNTRLSETTQNIEIRIIDVLGHEVLRFIPSESETTYVVPVFDYTVGVYFQCFEKDVLLKSEEFVVVR